MALPDEPLTRSEQYLNRTATGSGTIPDEPLTRVEMYLNKIATGDGDVPEVPLTRMEQYLDYIAENGGGGVDPESITLVTLNVSSNGTTNAPTGKAYNKVVANVPNTYGASDEGKVVSNGALVSQTAHAEVTQNGTIDTTLNNSVTVNVPDGFPTDTASGAIASFPDGADDIPVESLVAQIVPVQSGSGDPSPDNVRPISGFTGCKVSKAGKNLLNPEARENTSVNIYFYRNTGIVLKAGVTYTVSVKSASNASGIYVNKYPGIDRVAFVYNAKSVTFTPTEDVVAWFDFYYATKPQEGAENVEIQLELGSTATDYEPYQGDTYNIAFPSEAGTVYGGTLDAANGVLTVTKGLIPSYSGEALPGEWISSMDVYAQGVTPTTGAQVCYDLASPVTYQLDHVTITTLLGVNSIWADTGDVVVEYYADVDLYVQKKSVTLDTLNATANGTYTPTTGHAYSSVVVAIPAVTGVSF